AGVALALGDPLGPHEDPGPDGLRAGVAAPDTTREGGDEEQAEGADDQQKGQQEEVLRLEGCAEDVELAGRQVPQDCLAAIDVQPGGTEEQEKQERHTNETDVLEEPLVRARVDGFALGV